MPSVSAGASAVKPKQHGILNGVTALTGALNDEDSKYYDVTISEVKDISKCLVLVNGTATESITYAGGYAYSGVKFSSLSGRLINNTTLRISAMVQNNTNAGNYIKCAWDVIEFN